MNAGHVLQRIERIRYDGDAPSLQWRCRQLPHRLALLLTKLRSLLKPTKQGREGRQRVRPVQAT